MKTKLTVTVDSDTLPRAKRYARSRGVSLSSLIDAALREMATHESASFVERWSGAFEPAKREDARYEALSEKYL